MLSLIKKTGIFALSGLSYQLFNSKVLQCSSNLSERNNVERHAIVILSPLKNSGVLGMVSFSQKNYSEPTKVVAQIYKGKPNSDHSILVHQYGDVISNGENLGSIFDGKVGFRGILKYFLLINN